MTAVKPETANGVRPGWTFLTNHAHVLIALQRDPGTRVRDLAVLVGITERAVHQILSDLENGQVIQRVRTGRRNVYRINRDVRLRHSLEAHHNVGDLLSLAQ